MKTRKSCKTPTTVSKHHVKCNENQWKHDLLKSKHFGAPWPMAGQSHLHRLKRYAEPMRRGIPGPGCISGNQISSGCGLQDVRNNAIETSKMIEMQGIALKKQQSCIKRRALTMSESSKMYRNAMTIQFSCIKSRSLRVCKFTQMRRILKKTNNLLTTDELSDRPKTWKCNES